MLRHTARTAVLFIKYEITITGGGDEMQDRRHFTQNMYNVTDFYHVCFISTDCIVILLCSFIFVSHCCFLITVCIAGEP